MENNQGILPFPANLSKIVPDLMKQNEKCSNNIEKTFPLVYKQ